MSAGGHGEFDLEGDATSIVNAYRIATAEMKTFDDAVKKSTKGWGEMSEEAISTFTETSKKAKEWREIIQLLETDVKSLTKAQKELGGAPNLLGGDFKKQEQEIDQIRRERMQAEGQARAKEELEILRIVETAKRGIQEEMEADNLRFYNWQQNSEKMLREEVSRQYEIAEATNRQIMADRKRSDQWVAATRDMMGADAIRAQQENEEIFNLARAAEAAIKQEREAEILRHQVAMEGRKDEIQMVQALALLSASEAKALASQLGLAGDMVRDAARLRESSNFNVEGFARQSRAASRYREVIGQLSYAVGDFLSVQGDLSDRIRAIANNFQYLAMTIGGTWGAAINALTLGVQVGSQLWKSMSNAAKGHDEAAAAAGRQATAVEALVEQIEKATVAEDQLAKARKQKDVADAMQKAKETFEKEQKGAQEMLGSTYEGAAEMIRQKEQAGTATVGDRFNYGMAFMKETFGVNAMMGYGQNEQARIAQQAKERMDSAQAEFQKAGKLAQEAMAGIEKQARVKAAEKEISPMKGKVQEVYERTALDEGPEAGRKRIEEIIRTELPENLRAVAGDVAKRIAETGDTSLAGKRAAAMYDGRLPAEVAADEAKRKADEARRVVQEKKTEFEADRFLSPQEKAIVKGLDNIADALELNYKKLKAKADEEQEAQKRKLIQGPAVQRQPQQARNGNA